MKAKVVLAGGGTGGHVFPVLNVAQALLDRNADIKLFYIGQIAGPERKYVEDANLRVRGNEIKIPFYGIVADKLRRYFSWRIFALPWAILIGTRQAYGHLRSIRPQVVFCKGGYVTVPVALAARLLGIPIILHETDASMGLANRLVAPIATKIAFSFPRPDFLKLNRTGNKYVYTGQPVSKKFFSRATGRKHSHPNLLVFGGSQGSAKINSLIKEILPDLLEKYHVTHITGSNDYGKMKVVSSNRCYKPISFSNEIDELFRQADLIISRAGGSIFEMAAVGRPLILIPIANSANNHQAVNAEIFAEHNAAIMLDETKLSSRELLVIISSLMRDSKKRLSLSENVGKFAEPKAADNVSQLILEEVK